MSVLQEARQLLVQAHQCAELATKDHEVIKLALLAGKASVDDYATSLRYTHKVYAVIAERKVRLFFLEQLDYESKHSKQKLN